MNHFFIITNRDKDMDLSTTNEIKHFLRKKGKTCRMRPEEVHGTLSEAEASRTLEREIPAETECVIVLGGDGTLLRAARNLVNKQPALPRHQSRSSGLSHRGRPQQHPQYSGACDRGRIYRRGADDAPGKCQAEER